MSKIACAGVACMLALCCGTAQPQVPPPLDKPAKGPELGFDYQALIDGHQALIKSGKAEQAVAYLAGRAKFPQAFTAAEELKKKFSTLYGTAGKYDGHELSGYKRISSRAYAFFVVGHYERLLIQFTYSFERVQGEWKLLTFSMSDNLDDILRALPFQAIEKK